MLVCTSTKRVAIGLTGGTKYLFARSDGVQACIIVSERTIHTLREIRKMADLAFQEYDDRQLI